MRKELVVFIVLLSIFLATGCAGNKPATPAEKPVVTPVETPVTPVSDVTPQPEAKGKIIEVDIQNSAFNPQSVEIFTGDTVRWTNKDSIAHTVTGSTFESKVLENGDTYEFLFTDAGTYNYNCSIHPSMKGTVVVAQRK